MTGLMIMLKRLDYMEVFMILELIILKLALKIYIIYTDI